MLEYIQELLMPQRRDMSPTRAKLGETPTSSVSARSDIGENSASELVESPVKPGRKNPLDPHDFADGGGGGGAEAFSRAKRKPRE